MAAYNPDSKRLMITHETRIFYFKPNRGDGDSDYR